jgi:steroid 5-alpha reductase family enzyme
MDGLTAAMPAAAAAVAVLMVVTWALSMRLRDASIVDVAWGLAFVLVAWIALALGDGEGARPPLVALLTMLWGLRLAAYIGARKRRQGGEDPRYGKWRAKRPDTFWIYSLFAVFLFQGLLVWIVALPVTAAAASDGSLGPLDLAGVAIWAVGLAIEATGDAQMARFKADPANRGRIMDRGLWRYTRHPNYFGECLVWWGLFALALSAGAWWAVASPLVMTLLLTRVSGRDHLERSMSERPGYADYVRRTSGFVPLPPRSAAG